MRELSGKPKSMDGKYKIESDSTIEAQKCHLEKAYDKDKSAEHFDKLCTFFDKLESGKNPKVRIARKGEQYYRAGRIGGDYLTSEDPGKTSKEMKENLQLHPSNKAEKKSLVELTKAQIVMESDIKAQPIWAKEAGYKPKDSIKQTVLLGQKLDDKVEDRYQKLQSLSVKK